MFSFFKSVIQSSSDANAATSTPDGAIADKVEMEIIKAEENISPVLKEEITLKEEVTGSPPDKIIDQTISPAKGAETVGILEGIVVSTESRLDSDSFLEELTEDQPMTTATVSITSTAAAATEADVGAALLRAPAMSSSVLPEPVSPMKEEKEDTWKNIITPLKVTAEEKIPLEIIVNKMNLESTLRSVKGVENCQEKDDAISTINEKTILTEELSSKECSPDPIKIPSEFSSSMPEGCLYSESQVETTEVKSNHNETILNPKVNLEKDEKNETSEKVIEIVENDSAILKSTIQILLCKSENLKSTAELLQSTNEFMESTTQILESSTQILESTSPLATQADDEIWQKKLNDLEILEEKAQNMLDTADITGEADDDNMEKGSEEGSDGRWSHYNDGNEDYDTKSERESNHINGNNKNDIDLNNLDYNQNDGNCNEDDDDNNDDDKNEESNDNSDDNNDDDNNNNDDIDKKEGDNDNNEDNDDDDILYGNIEDELIEIAGAYVSDDENDDNEDDSDIITNIREQVDIGISYDDYEAESSVEQVGRLSTGGAIGGENEGARTEYRSNYTSSTISAPSGADYNLSHSKIEDENTYAEEEEYEEYEEEEKKNSSIPLPQSITNNARDLLPIDAYREEILKRIARDRVTIIHGETGCGKSSRLPVILLDDAEERGVKCRMMVRTELLCCKYLIQLELHL